MEQRTGTVLLMVWLVTHVKCFSQSPHWFCYADYETYAG